MLVVKRRAELNTDSLSAVLQFIHTLKHCSLSGLRVCFSGLCVFVDLCVCVCVSTGVCCRRWVQRSSVSPAWRGTRRGWRWGKAAGPGCRRGGDGGRRSQRAWPGARWSEGMGWEGWGSLSLLLLLLYLLLLLRQWGQMCLLRGSVSSTWSGGSGTRSWPGSQWGKATGPGWAAHTLTGSAWTWTCSQAPPAARRWRQSGLYGASLTWSLSQSASSWACPVGPGPRWSGRWWSGLQGLLRGLCCLCRGLGGCAGPNLCLHYWAELSCSPHCCRAHLEPLSLESQICGSHPHLGFCIQSLPLEIHTTKTVSVKITSVT